MKSIMDPIVDAENMVSILEKRLKHKLTAAARFDAIQRQMQINATLELSQAVETASGRPQVGGTAQDAHDWFTNHPNQSVWLINASREGNPFATSLLNGLRKFGSLTDKQQAALDKITSEDPSI